MKFKEGQIVEHKISNKKYVVVKFYRKLISKRPSYECSDGLGEDYFCFEEPELKSADKIGGEV